MTTIDAARADPAQLARTFINDNWMDDVPTIRRYRQGWWVFENRAFRYAPKDEIQSHVVGLFDRYKNLTQRVLGDVLTHIEAKTILRADQDPPFWIDLKHGTGWSPSNIVATRDKIVHLETGDTKDATPRLFNQCATSFAYNANPPAPMKWLEFLEQVWPGDPEAVDALRMWFGYCLAANTSQQKMLCVFGPKRSGKGTIVRVLTQLVGTQNVASPTLSSIGAPFGLQALLGKSLATIADARIGGRTDTAVVAERILSITGEDALTIDRKFLEPITVRLPVRLVLVSNELPKILDASGALQSRMIVLQTARSFEGQEDIGLEAKLRAELPAILQWAIAGWRSLAKRGRLLQAKSGQASLEQWRDMSSPVGAFVRDRCELQGRTRCDDLYEAFLGWLEVEGHRHSPNKATFGRDLQAVDASIQRRRANDSTGRYYFYDGISLI